ncbi:hypothetical protein QR680_016570 [Steinernema hermaphroditum]|uniref:Uncharacterized protein n=1 Tax=Steinernema hermaphroditum TaxID=289476 RepID=A0AA39LMJ2_9BILA|nr:hypothetical protein QR680_016570 [Steinernema hermaphroditum]
MDFDDPHLYPTRKADFQKMDHLPPDFYDDVFGQLQKKDIQPARLLPGMFGVVATDHYNQRRELKLLVSMPQANRCDLELLDLSMLRAQSISFSDLHSKYDRLVHIALSEAWEEETELAMPLESALRKISLVLRLAANCEFVNTYTPSIPAVFCREFFKLLARSQAFAIVETYDHGKECEEFVRKQMESVHLEVLSLGGVWSEDLNGAIASVARNPKFSLLSCHSPSVSLDYETVVSLLHRWANGDLKKAYVYINVSFDKQRLRSFLHNLGCTELQPTFKLADRRDLYLYTRTDFMVLFIGS